jgi:hypothetical protein
VVARQSAASHGEQALILELARHLLRSACDLTTAQSKESNVKFNEILSTDLPEIDESTKECVNQGQWLLYKSEARATGGGHVAFYLKAGPSVFGLNERGQVLEKVGREAESPQIDELFYFSDLPKPHSLSNASLSTNIE